MTIEDHLKLARPALDRGEHLVITGSGVFGKSKERVRIFAENHDKELVQVGDYWLAKNQTTTNQSVTVT